MSDRARDPPTSKVKCRLDVGLNQLRKYFVTDFDEGSLPDIVQHGNVLLLSKDLTIFYLLLLQPVMCLVAALKILPVHHP